MMHIQETTFVTRRTTIRLLNRRRRFPVREDEDNCCSGSHCQRKGDRIGERKGSCDFPFFSLALLLPVSRPRYRLDDCEERRLTIVVPRQDKTKTVLTQEDLSSALNEYGIGSSRAAYYL